jgi:hypothetical protein
MANTESFDLETYLGMYVPKSLTPSRWAVLSAQVRDLVRLVAPTTEGEAKNLLGALTRYLARMGADQGDETPPLTADGIERFIALERTTGAEDSTLGRVSRQLRRLLAASNGEADPAARPTKGGSRPPFNPVTDDEWDELQRISRDWATHESEGSMTAFLRVGEECGYDAAAMASAGWGPAKIAAIRRTIVAEAGPRLELHRLRHRWLKRVLSESVPLSTLVTDHGLTRRDLERAVQGFTADGGSAALLRSA